MPRCSIIRKGHGGPAGRDKTMAKAPPIRKATPPPQISSSKEEGHLPTDPVERSPQREIQTGNGMPPMKRKKSTPLNLTREQEVSVIEWLKAHPELFDKSDVSYKDSAKKTALWNAKAEELGQGSGVLLLTWYRSMRTRYGKLYKTETKSGPGSSTHLTQRDKWIVENFHFLTPHIYVCPKRKTGLLTQKLASSTSATDQWHEELWLKQEDEDDEDNDLFAQETDVASCATPTTSASGSTAGPSRGKATGKRPPSTHSDSALMDNLGSPSTSASDSTAGPSRGKATGTRPPSTHSDSALMDHLASSSAQYDRMQAAVCSLISSQTNSVPKAYGSFLASFVEDVHPRLMSNFMRESWELVMRYKDQGDRLREEECRAPRPAPAVPVAVVPVAARPVSVATTVTQQQPQQQYPQAQGFSHAT